MNADAEIQPTANYRDDFKLFDFLVEGAITASQSAREAAKGLQFFRATATELARQRRLNQVVENQIIQIEEIFSIVVACDRTEQHNQVPFPPTINHGLTIRNYHNGIGRPSGCAPKDSAEADEASVCAAKRASSAPRL